jgi:hypothetical protein
MPMTKTPAKPPAPAPAQRRRGMTDEERKLFEESFKRNEETLRRLAKL